MGSARARKVSNPACKALHILTTARIRSANILLITVKALANEVAKNLVLAGIGSLTILDHENVTEEDLGAQFFIAQAQSEEDVIGKNVSYNRAEALPHPLTTYSSARKSQDRKSTK